MGESVDTYHRGDAGRRNNRLAFNVALLSKKYIAEHCYFSEKGGGYVLFWKGHNLSEDEMFVAMALADHGHKVELQPENNVIWVSNWRGGKMKYAEGTIDDKIYEQKTPSANKIDPVKKTLDHAVEKAAKYAVLYDKHERLHRDGITSGIADFLKYGHNQNKVDSLFVVNTKGEVYKYKL